jgi:membrane fusion protein, multidrug efflux system
MDHLENICASRRRLNRRVLALLAGFCWFIAGCGSQQTQQASGAGAQGERPGRQGGPGGGQQGGQGRRQGGTGAGGQAVPVMVDKVSLRTIPNELTAIGNVEPFATVAVKAQVSGPLLEARFRQGDFVRRGQVLFKIDERPFQADLERAQAALARDKAVAANNRVDAERYRQLFAEGIVPEQQVNSFVAAADAADALVRSDEAAVKAAQLNLGYCTITAPIDGHTGTLMVQPGNLVRASDVPMVVINQTSPVYVNFTVPQAVLPDIKKNMAKGRLRVTVDVPNDPGQPEQGTLVFVDNAVDASTGTIRLRATFQNARDRLWPGLFVNAVLRLSEQPNTPVVPAQAVTSGPDGQIVYVVKADNTVEARKVVSNRTVEGAAVIEQGLRAGETVVVDGQLRLVPGSRVDIKNNLTQAAEFSPGGAPNSGAPNERVQNRGNVDPGTSGRREGANATNGGAQYGATDSRQGRQETQR